MTSWPLVYCNRDDFTWCRHFCFTSNDNAKSYEVISYFTSRVYFSKLIDYENHNQYYNRHRETYSDRLSIIGDNRPITRANFVKNHRTMTNYKVDLHIPVTYPYINFSFYGPVVLEKNIFKDFPYIAICKTLISYWSFAATLDSDCRQRTRTYLGESSKCKFSILTKSRGDIPFILAYIIGRPAYKSGTPLSSKFWRI